MKPCLAAIRHDPEDVLSIHLRVAAPDAVYPVALFLADHRVAVLFDDFPKGHIWLEPRYIRYSFHEPPDLREFQTGVRKDGRYVRILRTHQIQQHLSLIHI